MGKATFQIPFYEDGSIPSYPESWNRQPLTWADPTPFTDTLVLIGSSRGRSAANFNFVSESRGSRFTVFMTDLVAMVRDARWREGKITATFIPCKRGQNYGVRLAESP